MINALELIKTHNEPSIQLAGTIAPESLLTMSCRFYEESRRQSLVKVKLRNISYKPNNRRVQYTDILSKILQSDYPSQWPEFQDLTLSLLQSVNINEVYAGLTMLFELTRVYRWKSGDSRLGLEGVVTTVFPVALQIAGKLLVDPNVAAGTMLVLILKAYKSAIAVWLEGLRG